MAEGGQDGIFSAKKDQQTRKRKLSETDIPEKQNLIVSKNKVSEIVGASTSEKDGKSSSKVPGILVGIVTLGGDQDLVDTTVTVLQKSKENFSPTIPKELARLHYVPCNPKTTVVQLKKLIANDTEIDPNEQVLFNGDDLLDCNMCLADYGFSCDGNEIISCIILE